MNRSASTTASLRMPRVAARYDAPAADARVVAAWLFACCALVFAMIVVGGVTRLTRSGLSITEWQPIVGALPPLNDAQWEDAFAKYRATPEFRLVNHAMDLTGFEILMIEPWWRNFFWNMATVQFDHRVLASLLALVVPLLWWTLYRTESVPVRARRGGHLLVAALARRSDWASRRCSRSCRCISPRRNRQAPCWCSWPC